MKKKFRIIGNSSKQSVKHPVSYMEDPIDRKLVIKQVISSISSNLSFNDCIRDAILKMFGKRIFNFLKSWEKDFNLNKYDHNRMKEFNKKCKNNALLLGEFISELIHKLVSSGYELGTFSFDNKEHFAYLDLTTGQKYKLVDSIEKKYPDYYAELFFIYHDLSNILNGANNFSLYIEDIRLMSDSILSIAKIYNKTKPSDRAMSDSLVEEINTLKDPLQGGRRSNLHFEEWKDDTKDIYSIGEKLLRNSVDNAVEMHNKGIDYDDICNSFDPQMRLMVMEIMKIKLEAKRIAENFKFEYNPIKSNSSSGCILLLDRFDPSGELIDSYKLKLNAIQSSIFQNKKYVEDFFRNNNLGVDYDEISQFIDFDHLDQYDTIDINNLSTMVITDISDVIKCIPIRQVTKYKVRFIYVVNSVYQSTLKNLNDTIYSLLKFISSDYTKNQSGAKAFGKQASILINQYKNKVHSGCYDIKNASGNLDRFMQSEQLKWIFGDEPKISALLDLFLNISNQSIIGKSSEMTEEFSLAYGNMMGILGSFMTFAFQHHYIIWVSYFANAYVRSKNNLDTEMLEELIKCSPKNVSTNRKRPNLLQFFYANIGDDTVQLSCNPEYGFIYISCMKCNNAEIELSKSHESIKGAITVEIASSMYVNGNDVTGCPPGVFLSMTKSIGNRMQYLRTQLERDFYTLPELYSENYTFYLKSDTGHCIGFGEKIINASYSAVSCYHDLKKLMTEYSIKFDEDVYNTFIRGCTDLTVCSCLQHFPVSLGGFRYYNDQKSYNIDPLGSCVFPNLSSDQSKMLLKILSKYNLMYTLYNHGLTGILKSEQLERVDHKDINAVKDYLISQSELVTIIKGLFKDCNKNFNKSYMMQYYESSIIRNCILANIKYNSALTDLDQRILDDDNIIMLIDNYLSESLEKISINFDDIETLINKSYYDYNNSDIILIDKVCNYFNGPEMKYRTSVKTNTKGYFIKYLSYILSIENRFQDIANMLFNNEFTPLVRSLDNKINVQNISKFCDIEESYKDEIHDSDLSECNLEDLQKSINEQFLLSLEDAKLFDL